MKNVIALTGDPASIGEFPQATSVFDVKSDGLVKIISSLNQGVDFAGNKLNKATDLCIGVAVNPGAKDWDEERRKLDAKLEAGAQFGMTQPVFDLEVLERFINYVNSLNFPVLVGTVHLRSLKRVEFWRSKVKVFIPDEYAKRLEHAGDKAREEGIKIAKEVLALIRSCGAGAYIVEPTGEYEVVGEMLAG